MVSLNYYEVISEESEAERKARVMEESKDVYDWVEILECHYEQSIFDVEEDRMIIAKTIEEEIAKAEKRGAIKALKGIIELEQFHSDTLESFEYVYLLDVVEAIKQLEEK